ncbi:hypothetical protein GY632_7563 [Trichophyton interdigitale]|nr:hypothetical protein GY632_7563 [Trichophyton interdigitale]
MAPKSGVQKSSRSRNRVPELRVLAATVNRYGQVSDFPCDNCFLSGVSCVVMAKAPSGRRLVRCASCIRDDCPCVGRVSDSLEWIRWEERKFFARRRVFDSRLTLTLLSSEAQRLQTILVDLQRKILDESNRLANYEAAELQLQLRGDEMLGSAESVIGPPSSTGPSLSQLLEGLPSGSDIFQLPESRSEGSS